MNFKIIVFVLLFVNLLTGQVTRIGPVLNQMSSFAIVIDEATYNQTKDAVTAYRDAVEKDGLSTYILISSWQKPEEIKSELVKLYNAEPKLEGAVFVGNIPVPMIRNAQHMSSAFKMDEDRYPWHRSSVASDRFYEDFDLKFTYLKQDSVNKLLFYYSLLPESPQRIEKEIYSARIKPSGDNKTEKIRSYLFKAAARKSEQNFIDNAFVFTGHGYHSESLTAWADERYSLREQFPKLFKPEGRIKIHYFDMSREMKERLLSEIQNKNLDLAIFHAHGDDDMQLLLNYPTAQNVNENIESVKMFLRSKLRSARDRGQSVDDAKAYFLKEYKIPEDWFDGAFEDSVMQADSLLGYKLDIYIKDVREINPQARFIMFDECFNASFQLDEYIAGEYVFGNGGVIIAEGNSVNCLQDKWADEFLGLFDLGIRIGNWHKLKNLIESNLIGDPTFRFASGSGIDINKILFTENDNGGLWNNYLSSEIPEMKSLAVTKTFELLGQKFENELVKLYMTDPSVNVRLHALKCLAGLNDEAFHKILKVSINDPYEYIRRKTADWMGEIGDTSYIPYLAYTLLTDESERTTYSAKSSLEFMGSDASMAQIEKVLDNMPAVVSKENIKERYRASFKRNNEWLHNELLPNVLNDTLKIRSRVSDARTFRNYKFIHAVPQLIKLAADRNADPKVRTVVLEALGWFNFSLQRESIIVVCDNIIGDKSAPPEVTDEAVRTRNRLITGSNDVMLP